MAVDVPAASRKSLDRDAIRIASIRGDETLQDCPRDGGRPGARTSNGAVTGKAHHWLVDFTLVK